MSLKIGGSKSKTKTTSNTQTTTTRTPTAPGWASSLTQGAASQVGDLMRRDPGSYVAPAHDLQLRAAEAARTLPNLDGAWTKRLSEPAAQIGDLEQVQAASLLDGLANYMSPYTKDVVDSTLADFDVGASRTRAQQDLDLAGSGAFGGSGAALTRSMTEGELSRARANAAATLRDQAFTRGASLASEDAARRQQAAMLNAQLAFDRASQNARLAEEGWSQRFNAELAAQAQERATIATQAELGAALREVEQQQRQAPVTSAQQIVAMLNGLPINLFTGEHVTSNAATQGTSKGTEVSFEAHKFF